MRRVRETFDGCVEVAPIAVPVMRPGAVSRENFRRSEMRKGAAEFQGAGILPTAAQNNRCRRAKCPSGSCRCPFSDGWPHFSCPVLQQRPRTVSELFAAMDRRSEIVLEQDFFLRRGQKPPRTRIGLRTPDFAQLDSFAGRSHAKPIRARFLQRLGNLRPTVAVAIALDDAQNFPRGLPFFRSGIHVIANGAIDSARAPQRETSAQTGRPMKSMGFFFLLVMNFPKNLVYDIPAQARKSCTWLARD